MNIIALFETPRSRSGSRSHVYASSQPAKRRSHPNHVLRLDGSIFKALLLETLVCILVDIAGKGRARIRARKEDDGYDCI